MEKDREFWDRIGSRLAEELGLSILSEDQLELIAKSIEVEPLSDEKIEAILGGTRPELPRERTEFEGEEAHSSVISVPLIANEMALALNRNRGSQEPDIDKKVAKLRAEALKKTDDHGDGDVG